VEYKKSQSPQDNEKDKDPIETDISAESLEAVAEEGKSGIAKCGRRVKEGQKKDTARLSLSAPAQKEQNGADSLDQKGVEKNVPDERGHVFGAGMMECPLDKEAFSDGYFLAGDKEDEGGKGHDSQSSQLKQDQNNHLAERCKTGRRIPHDQSRHTDGRSRGKEGVDEGDSPLLSRPGEREEPGPDKNDDKKTHDQQLGRMELTIAFDGALL